MTKSLLIRTGKLAGELADVAVVDEAGEFLAGLAAHVPLDAPQPLHQHPHVVIAVHVLVDVLDDLLDRQRLPARRLDVEVRRVPEILDQGPVEAVEDGEVGLVDLGAKPRAPAEHLHPENARFHRPHEDHEFQAGDVDTRAQHVHRHHHLGVGPVAELADLLQGPVHAGAAGDLLHEVVALAEDLPADLDHLVRMRGVGQVVDRKDQDLGEMAFFLFVKGGIACDLLDDLAVAVRRRDVPFDLRRRRTRARLRAGRRLPGRSPCR